MTNWVDEIMRSTEHVEVPRPFLKWSLYAAIAAVASPNVSLNRQGAYNLYPNLYVMLLADTGVGKGFGIWVAKSLVKIVDNTRVFSGRNSIQKIVSDMAIAYTRDKKEMIKDARAFLSSGEFINFLLRDDQAISILTEWYDTHYVREWANSLKSTGVEILKDVNITLLGASNADYLRESVPVAAIRGGFFGRIMFVYASEKGIINALIDEPEENQQVAKNFPLWADYLKEIAKIKVGSEFKISDKARQHFRPWYHDLQDRIKSGQVVDKTGYMHRLQDHALKLAMVLSLAESPELYLTKHHVEEGIHLAESLITTVKRATLGVGMSLSAPKNEAFLKTLFKAQDHKMTRERMLQYNHAEFDSNELDRVALTMEDAGLVKACGSGGNASYQLTPMGRKQFIDVYSMLKAKERKRNEADNKEGGN